MFGLVFQILLWTIGGAVTVWAVASVINYVLIKEEVKRQIPNAFKAIITSKTTKKIDIGIFSYDDEKIKDIEMTSEEGVDENLSIGQVIYC